MQEDRIEQLKKKLYSREGITHTERKFEINTTEETIPNNWGEQGSTLHIEDMSKDSGTHPFFKKFLFGASVFFLISVCVALYMFFMGGNQVSSANVDIQVVGPISVSSGEFVDLGISLINENKTDLQNVVFTVEYPDGARATSETTEALKRTTGNIDTIAKGSLYATTTKFVLFGDKDIPKTLNFKLEYSVVGSNARFTKEKKYDVLIGSSPLLVQVSTPKEINSGQQFQMEVTVISNSTSLLKDVVVNTEYPYGFVYKDSSIKPENNNQTWKIGDLKNGDSKTFTITGSIIAQDNEERTIRFMVGVLNAEQELDTVLGTAMPTLLLRKPFFSTSFTLDGDTRDVVGTLSEKRVQGKLSITNSVAEILSNVVVEIKMTGQALNKSGVRVQDGGFYQSNQNMIVWDKNTNSRFEILDPGSKLDTSFELQDFTIPQNVKNPEISFDVTLRGIRSVVGGGVDNVVSVVNKKLRFITKLSVVVRSFRSGVFTNTGPVPPKREVPSTYTIEWALSNTYNDLSNIRAQAVLPVYVDWVGQVSPSTENVTYDKDSRTITWNVGAVGAFAGFSTSAKKMQFQVRLNPSVSQVGMSPVLLGEVTVLGTDGFAGKDVNAVSGVVTTDTADGFSGIVQ